MEPFAEDGNHFPSIGEDDIDAECAHVEVRQRGGDKDEKPGDACDHVSEGADPSRPREPERAAAGGFVVAVGSVSVLWSRFPCHKNGFRLSPIPARLLHYPRSFTEVRGETV